jgi:rhodanese-related sulfurtransferase
MLGSVPDIAIARAPRLSAVREFAATNPEIARAHFESKLAFETDPADLFVDQQNGDAELLVLDARSAEAFDDAHIPSAVNLPSRRITAESTADFSRDRLIVAYCWGPGCNGATRAAARLAALGFQVKELIGGLEYWQREGYPVARAADTAPLETR